MTREFANSHWPIWVARLPLEVSLAFAFGIVLAVLGPYDTYHFPILPRFGYWIGLSAAWLLLAGIVDFVLQSVFTGRLHLAVRQAIAFVVVALPMTAIVWVASDALTNGTEVAPLMEIYWQTLLTGAVGSLIAGMLLARAGRGGVAKRGESPPDTGPATLTERPISRLEDRLPPHLRGSILALSSEDHYVRVHTGQGSHMLLMRLSDAIDELDGLAGERVHRSWWVARSAPCEFQSRGRTAILRMCGAPDVPVSTPYLDVARSMAADNMTRD